MISPRTYSRGFTLIELMVSIAIFSIVVVIAGGAYLNLIGIERKTRATNDVVNNLSFVIDSMARTVRTGKQYGCGGTLNTNCWSPTLPSSTFTFVDKSGQQITYLLNTTTHSIGQCTGSNACTNDTAAYFTDPLVTIDRLTFYVRGVGGVATGDRTQPQVLIIIHGTISTDANHTPTTFSVETEATQRGIDI